MRSDTIEARSLTDPVLYEQKIQLAREMARVLRQNVVQAEKVQGEGEDKWRLRLTKHTELGSNESIKSPSPMNVPAGGCCGQVDVQSPVVNVPEMTSPVRYMTWSERKKAHRDRKVPELREEDLEETFVRGSGPGGQSVNKTENNVQLIHKSTGIRVTCHETRSLATNRKLARRILLEKLDKLQNPGLSKSEMRDAKDRERERQRRKKARKKARELHQRYADAGSPPTYSVPRRPEDS